MFKIALYGKGGIGKSTTACNLSAALTDSGYKVMQIGCDPKADSTRLLMRGVHIPSVLDKMREAEQSHGSVELQEIIHESPEGVLCIEAGGPIPGLGCAGRGIVAAFDLLKSLNAYELYKPDIVIYDVLGDVVCGGFAMPLRGEYSDAVMIVTSGEMMSLYAAGNILQALARFERRGYARFVGLIANLRDKEDEMSRIAAFCEEENAWLAVAIPRSQDVQQAEDACCPVSVISPESEAMRAYRDLSTYVGRLAKEEG